jgi:hypothetical protein
MDKGVKRVKVYLKEFIESEVVEGVFLSLKEGCIFLEGCREGDRIEEYKIPCSNIKSFLVN